MGKRGGLRVVGRGRVNGGKRGCVKGRKGGRVKGGGKRRKG